MNSAGNSGGSSWWTGGASANAPPSLAAREPRAAAGEQWQWGGTDRSASSLHSLAGGDVPGDLQTQKNAQKTQKTRQLGRSSLGSEICSSRLNLLLLLLFSSSSRQQGVRRSPADRRDTKSTKNQNPSLLQISGLFVGFCSSRVVLLLGSSFRWLGCRGGRAAGWRLVMGLTVRRRGGGKGLQLVAWGKTQQGAAVVAGFSGDDRERGKWKWSSGLARLREESEERDGDREGSVMAGEEWPWSPAGRSESEGWRGENKERR